MNLTRRFFPLISFIALGGSLLASHPGLWADGTPPATSPSTTRTENPQATRPSLQALQAQYASILAGLGDADFKVREETQTKLDAVGWQNLEDLRQLAAAAVAEVKSRLEQRIEAIEDQLAVTPPPISLDLKDATLEQVRAALHNAGVEVKALTGPRLPDPHYTLSTKEITFVELMRQLNGQHPVSVNEGVPVPELVAKQYYPTYFTPQALMFLEDAPKDMITLEVLIDPRIKIADCSAQIEKSSDEFGQPVSVRSPQNVARDYRPDCIWHHLLIAEMPKGSHKLPLVKGTLTVTIVVREETLELDHPEKRLGEAIKLGKGSLTLKSLEPTTNRIAYSIGPGPTEEEIQAKIAAGTIKSPAELQVSGKIVDADGHELINFSAGQSGGQGLLGVDRNGPDAKPIPVKVILTVPIKTAEIKIPFELRDVRMNSDPL